MDVYGEGVLIDGFDVNYDNFHRIMLQYKPSSGSDNDWTTLMSYYNDQTLFDQAEPRLKDSIIFSF